jgi:hypothetical protein
MGERTGNRVREGLWWLSFAPRAKVRDELRAIKLGVEIGSRRQRHCQRAVDLAMDRRAPAAAFGPFAIR